MVLALVLLLWLAVAVSGTVAGLSQWSEHISAVEFEKRYGKVCLGGHHQPVEWTTFRLSPRSDPIPGPWSIECP